ncbi:MAG: hypothetical protein KGJ62_07075 [Armatimonadetes bacterium]|nr:hypothetical protein [Armatimonadota bacterium]MDE2207304.1 hypothetical protein [Armatimonadota bacterium]
MRPGAAEPIAALNRVTIMEYGVPYDRREHLVPLYRAAPHILLADWVCPWLRPTAVEMLVTAESRLPTGLRLRVMSAVRTRRMQMAGWDAYFAQMKSAHPHWPLSALCRATNRFFAPYDQKAPPGHCTGGAVDVQLVDADGKALDVSTPLEGWAAAQTAVRGLSSAARRNRGLLVDAMLSAGFSNCRDEYWHYSYGDSAWAVRTGATECPWGWAHPPIEIGDVGAKLGARSSLTVTSRSPIGMPTAAEVSITTQHPGPRKHVSTSWEVWNAACIAVRLQIRAPAGGRRLRLFVREAGGKEAAVEADLQRTGTETYLVEITPVHDRTVLTLTSRR